MLHPCAMQIRVKGSSDALQMRNGLDCEQHGRPPPHQRDFPAIEPSLRSLSIVACRQQGSLPTTVPPNESWRFKSMEIFNDLGSFDFWVTCQKRSLFFADCLGLDTFPPPLAFHHKIYIQIPVFGTFFIFFFGVFGENSKLSSQSNCESNSQTSQSQPIISQQQQTSGIDWNCGHQSRVKTQDSIKTFHQESSRLKSDSIKRIQDSSKDTHSKPQNQGGRSEHPGTHPWTWTWLFFKVPGVFKKKVKTLLKRPHSLGAPRALIRAQTDRQTDSQTRMRLLFNIYVYICIYRALPVGLACCCNLHFKRLLLRRYSTKVCHLKNNLRSRSEMILFTPQPVVFTRIQVI